MSENNPISRIVSSRLRGIIEEALVASWEEMPMRREVYGRFTQALPDNNSRTLAVEKFIEHLDRWIKVGGEWTLGADTISTSTLENLRDVAVKNKQEYQNKIDYVMLTPQHVFGLN